MGERVRWESKLRGAESESTHTHTHLAKVSHLGVAISTQEDVVTLKGKGGSECVRSRAVTSTAHTHIP